MKIKATRCQWNLKKKKKKQSGLTFTKHYHHSFYKHHSRMIIWPPPCPSPTHKFVQSILKKFNFWAKFWVKFFVLLKFNTLSLLLKFYTYFFSVWCLCRFGTGLLLLAESFIRKYASPKLRWLVFIRPLNAGLNQENHVLDPLGVQHLDNRLYIMEPKTFSNWTILIVKKWSPIKMLNLSSRGGLEEERLLYIQLKVVTYASVDQIPLGDV